MATEERVTVIEIEMECTLHEMQDDTMAVREPRDCRLVLSNGQTVGMPIEEMVIVAGTKDIVKTRLLVALPVIWLDKDPVSD